MKKIIYLFMACFAILFASCKNDDGGISSYSKNIVGDWELIKATEYYNGQQYNVYEPIYMSIYADHSLIWNEEGYAENGTWMISDNILLMSWSWGEKINWTIKSLTSKELILQNGPNYEYVEYVFKKN